MDYARPLEMHEQAFLLKEGRNSFDDIVAVRKAARWKCIPWI